MASFTERYHELTKYNPQTYDKLGPVRWEDQPPPFKEINATEKIDLKPFLRFLGQSWESEWTPEECELGSRAGLAQLLFFTLGVTAKIKTHGGDLHLRASPSAGGLYPTELYVIIRNSDDIEAGIYHYHSLESALIPVWKGDFWPDLRHHFLGQAAVEASSCIMLFTGIYGRSAWRYKERAYRRILLDTGHALGNLMEVCETRDLSLVNLGSFIDEGIEELLFLTAREEFPLVAVALSQDSDFSSLDRGQHGSLSPKESIMRVERSEPMQVQQNTCERIFASDELKPAHLCRPAYPRMEMEDLDLYRRIAVRRSCRRFSGAECTQKKMLEILSYGYRSYRRNNWCLASHYLRSMVIILNVEGWEPGVYHYDATRMSLELKRSGDFKAESYYLCLGQDLASECSFLLVQTVDLAQLVNAYGDRGYRYVCLDAGQIGERINLVAMHLDLGSSGIGGYFDDQANEIIGLSLSEAVIYITVIGVPSA